MCRVWDIPAHGADDGGGHPRHRRRPHHHGCDFFFFFFFRKKKKFVFKRNKIFSFSKQNGGQNGFKRGGKHVLKKRAGGKKYFLLKK
mgnify:FL=1